MQEAKFSIGQVVRHKLFPFRGVVFDVDPEFSNTEEWLEAIPEPVRPDRKQPFYHLFAENSDSHYVAYVSVCWKVTPMKAISRLVRGSAVFAV